MLEAYIDGCCEPNPGGTASFGILVLKGSNRSTAMATTFALAYGREETSYYRNGKKVVWEYSGIVGAGVEMSNNVAEYAALVRLLEWLDGNLLPGQQVSVLSDSQLLVNQMSLKWSAKSGKLYYPYYTRAIHLMLIGGFKGRISFRWIGRESNLADRLAVEALAEVGIVRRRS